MGPFFEELVQQYEKLVTRTEDLIYAASLCRGRGRVEDSLCEVRVTYPPSSRS
jgi:hypothetical protein